MTARIVAGLALVVALSGCGQVGPLYLPEDQATTTTVVPPTVDPAAVPATPATDPVATPVPDRTNEPRRRAN